MSHKQDIYLKLYSWGLSYIRNVQTKNFLGKGYNKGCYYEAELIHNLHLSILEEDITEHDIYFINTQAKWYIKNCNKNISPLYERNVKLLIELFKLLPDAAKKDIDSFPNPTK